MATDPDPLTDTLQTSHRDQSELGERLQAWLDARPDVGAGVTVVDCTRPEGNGMSSETVLFDTSEPDAAAPAGAGPGAVRRYVLRLAPEGDTCPIFPTYDMEAQADVMRLVAEQTEVPVPEVRWYEPDPGPLGAPFFVMGRVDGEVPPDVMPYTFDGSWVQEATPEQRARMQNRTVDILGAVHGVPFEGLDRLPTGPVVPAGASGVGSPGGGDAVGGTALRRHVAAEREYYAWAKDDYSFPLLEQAFDWLESHWPIDADAAPPVLCWGDSRIGNVLYRDFEPVGVLDWEMATVGPRELDLGWLIFMHQFFEGVTRDLGMAGLPDFLQHDAVAARYAGTTGHEPRDLSWFVVYGALRHGIFMTRAMRRRVLFGEMEMPDDPQDLILHRRQLEQMLS